MSKLLVICLVAVLINCIAVHVSAACDNIQDLFNYRWGFTFITAPHLAGRAKFDQANKVVSYSACKSGCTTFTPKYKLSDDCNYIEFGESQPPQSWYDAGAKKLFPEFNSSFSIGKAPVDAGSKDGKMLSIGPMNFYAHPL